MVTLRELYKATTAAAKKMVADNTAEAPPSKDDPKLGGASDDKVFKATNVKASTKPNNPMNEEELVELNQSTLKNYIGKASKAAFSAHTTSNVELANADIKARDKRFYMNRNSTHHGDDHNADVAGQKAAEHARNSQNATSTVFKRLKGIERASSRLKEEQLDETSHEQHSVHGVKARITPKDKMGEKKVFGANPHTTDKTVNVKARSVQDAHDEAAKHFEKNGYHVHMTSHIGKMRDGAKYVNEEITLQELKKVTLARYINAASHDKTQREIKRAVDIHKGKPQDKDNLRRATSRSIGINRASYKLAKEDFLNFVIEAETEKKDGRSEKNTAVPSATSPEDAENKAKRFYNLAKNTPTSEPEKKQHYMYIARKLYAKAKALRKTNKVNG